MKDGWAFVSRCDAPARGDLEDDFTVKQSFVGNQRAHPVLCVERAEIRSALMQGARIVSDLLALAGWLLDFPHKVSKALGQGLGSVVLIPQASPD
jgi:hypothetical protein